MNPSGGFLGASYNTFCSQLVAGAGSCGSHGPYHKHCNCALHGAGANLDGLSSTKKRVTLSNKKGRNGMFRSISVNNLADKSLHSSNGSGHPSETQSPFHECGIEKDEEVNGNSQTVDPRSNQTVMLMEELATLIKEMRCEDTDSAEVVECREDDKALPAHDQHEQKLHDQQDQKKNFGYRSGMFRSEPNLCAHEKKPTEAD